MERVYSNDKSEYIIMSKIMTLGENISEITTEINHLEQVRQFYYELSQDKNYPDDKIFHLEARNEIIKANKLLGNFVEYLSNKKDAKKLKKTL